MDPRAVGAVSERLTVPAFDLARAARRIEGPLADRWARLLERTAFVGGEEVQEFEEAFASFLEVRACVGVANGTDALVLALEALGVGPGDEVIVPSFTFIATAATVAWLGAVPVFADVDPATLNLDVTDAARRVTPKTVGVVGVHLYGCPFDVRASLELCAEHDLWLVEDSAQAHGARFESRRVGGFGRLATWSFYPSKNLGCFGDGGAVTTDDPELAARVRLLANHGATGRYRHERVGLNSRLDALQAAVLNCRLPLLDEDNATRRRIADRYRSALAGVGGIDALAEPVDVESVVHQFTVRSERRDALQASLAERGVGSAVHYPTPLHLQPAFAGRGEPPALPAAEAAAREVLCLPVFPELSDAEIDVVISALVHFAGTGE